jgi:hypothetical protein
MNPTRSAILHSVTRRAAVCAAALAAATAGTSAGTLEVSWTPSQSAAAPRYRLHVGTEPGRYTQIVESSEAKALLANLEDDRVYYMRVEELAPAVKSKARKGADDAKQPEALRMSTEMASLPSPRIDAIGSLLPAGEADTWSFTVQGRNFAEGAIVRTSLPSLRILSTERDSAGQLRVTVHHEPLFGSTGLPLVEAASVSVINPGPKAPEYFAARPERADVDGDGRVDANDLEVLRSRFGAASPEGQRVPEALLAASDLNGDGVVDGLDLDLLGSVLRAR